MEKSYLCLLHVRLSGGVHHLERVSTGAPRPEQLGYSIPLRVLRQLVPTRSICARMNAGRMLSWIGERRRREREMFFTSGCSCQDLISSASDTKANSHVFSQVLPAVLLHVLHSVQLLYSYTDISLSIFYGLFSQPYSTLTSLSSSLKSPR